MQGIGKNISLSAITFITQLLSGTVVYILLAREMSLQDFGLLSFGITLSGLVCVASEFGFSLMVQRDIPQGRFSLNEYVFNTFLIKSIIAAGVLICCGFYLFTFFKGSNYIIGWIFLFNGIVTAQVTYLHAVFRARNKFKFENYSAGFYLICIIIITIVYFLSYFNITTLAYSLLLAKLGQFTLLIIAYVHTFGLTQFSYNEKISNYLRKNSFSFGLHYIIGIFYFSIDNQMIAYYQGNEQLALYQAFFKIIMLMLMLCDLFNNVFLPYLSSLYSRSNNDDFNENAKLINKVVITLGLASFLFITLFAQPIVGLLYTEKYYNALSLTIPLSFVLIFRISSTIYAVLLTISDRQNIRVFIVFVSLVLNLILNFFFIPKYGIEGAAIVSLITHLVLMSLYGFFAKQIIGSLLIDKELLILLLYTIGLFLINEIVNSRHYLWFSIIILCIWFFSLLRVYDKKQLNVLIKFLESR